MQLYPAIDLRDGGAVRLTQGDFDRQLRYGDPLALAATLHRRRRQWIHVVDLNAARTGVPHERATLARIVELAGGAAGGGRRRAGCRPAGASGPRTTWRPCSTSAWPGSCWARPPSRIRRWPPRCARRWPGQVAVGLDYVVRPDGVAEARGHGWEEGIGADGVRAARPSGPVSPSAPWWPPPSPATACSGAATSTALRHWRLAALSSLPVIASGGVGTLEDLRALAG